MLGVVAIKHNFNFKCKEMFLQFLGIREIYDNTDVHDCMGSSNIFPII